MKIKLFVTLTICLISYFHLKGQDFDDYILLRSSGEIPEEFRTLFVKKFQNVKGDLDKGQKLGIRKAKEKILLKHSYFIDELILSGKVLFNDPVGQYLNKVTEVVLKQDPKLRTELKVYCVKSTEVNAVASDNGYIFVTLGLIAQLENEAQLAYILSHEFVHYKNKHSMSVSIEIQNIKKGKGEYKRISYEDKLLAKSNYSKELEFEADQKGLDIFLKTNYRTQSLNGVFDLLQYSYLPFDDIEFEKAFFETQYMTLPQSFFVEETALIRMGDAYDDSKSTHPNIRRRRKIIQRKISSISDEGKTKFIVSEKEFLKVREIARFELSRLYLLNRSYAKSIYNSYMLLKKHPGNKYLQISIAKALVGLSKYKNVDKFSEVHPDYSDIEGSSQQIFYFLNQLSGEELNALAVQYTWQLKNKYPADEYLRDMANNTLRELVYTYHATPLDYYDKPKEKVKKELKIEENEDLSQLSKYEKIKRKREIRSVGSEKEFIRYAFVDFSEDIKFTETFNKLIDDYEKEISEKEKKISREELRKKQNQERKEKKLIHRKGRALGIDKIVIVNPFYEKLDERKKEEMQFIDAESALLDFSEKLIKNASIAKLEMELLDPKSFKKDESDKFNDFALLNDWAMERIRHGNINLSVSDNNYVRKLVDKYNTKYFLWTGISTTREIREYAGYYVCLSALFFYTLPLGIIYAITPAYDTWFYVLLFDVETGKVILLEEQFINSNDRPDILNSRIYDIFFQIKNKRKL